MLCGNSSLARTTPTQQRASFGRASAVIPWCAVGELSVNSVKYVELHVERIAYRAAGAARPWCCYTAWPVAQTPGNRSSSRRKGPSNTAIRCARRGPAAGWTYCRV
jgi:hypothetical protein